MKYRWALLGVFGITVAVASGCNSKSSARTHDAGDASNGPSACTADPDCAAHQYCDAPTCKCVAGYTADGSGACAWTGVVVNPGFDATGGWTGEGASSFDPAATGSSDPGTALVNPIIEQTITMPRRSLAEPLVATLTYSKGHGMPGVALRLGRVWHYQYESLTSGYVTARTCLGAAEYAPETSSGAGVPLELLAEFDPPEGFDGDPGDPAYLIDHLEIVPALPGECPEVGVVANGDAEATDGWATTTTYPSASTGTTYGFEAGVGSGGSRGYHIHTDYTSTTNQYCQVTTVAIPISIPADGSPAISLYHVLSPGTQLEMDLQANTNPWVYSPRRFEVGTSGTTIACVQGVQRGTSALLYLSVSASGVICSYQRQLVDAVLDNVAIVDAPACGTGAIANPGFEQSAMFGMEGPAATIIQDASKAHTGMGVVAIPLTTINSSVFGGIGYVLDAYASNPTAPEGTAFAFYYRTVTTNPSNTTLNPVANYVADGNWHRSVTCFPNVELPPSFAVYRSTGIGFSAKGVYSGIETNPVVYVDDVEITTDPSCPAQ